MIGVRANAPAEGPKALGVFSHADRGGSLRKADPKEQAGLRNGPLAAKMAALRKTSSAGGGTLRADGPGPLADGTSALRKTRAPEDLRSGTHGREG